MRRLIWTVGLGCVGLLLSLKGADTPQDLWWVSLGTIWAATIGFGFGTIFSHKPPGRWTPIHWAVTLALLGPFFGLLTDFGVHPFSPMREQIAAAVLASLVGAFIGWVVGRRQLKRLRRNPGEVSGTS